MKKIFGICWWTFVSVCLVSTVTLTILKLFNVLVIPWEVVGFPILSLATLFVLIVLGAIGAMCLGSIGAILWIRFLRVVGRAMDERKKES